MIGVVLAAGVGSRLHPLTDDRPKTLLPIDDAGRTIFDVIVTNLAAAGVEQIVVVSGYRADVLDAHIAAIAPAVEVPITVCPNDHALDRNNCYSLWLARDAFSEGAMVCNGDTVHPVTVERTMLAAAGPGLSLALDDVKPLGEEEMKVRLRADGAAGTISKLLDPATAAGEYIGISVIGRSVASAVADALEATWRADTSLYYEDGYQRWIDEGGSAQVVPIGVVDWVEVDNHADLARARQIAGRC